MKNDVHVLRKAERDWSQGALAAAWVSPASASMPSKRQADSCPASR